MLLAFLGLITGFICIIISAEIFIKGASQLAYRKQYSPLIVGLTIVALGTSAPEMVVSAIAAIQGETAIAVGNVIGSNIANISLVLGLTILCLPITIQPHWLREQSIMLCAMTLCLVVLLMDAYIGLTEAVTLTLGLILFIRYLSRQKNACTYHNDEVTASRFSWQILLLIGLIGLPASAQCIVHFSTLIAKSLGVSEFIIGSTLVALGTSLPELATTFSAARQKKYELLLGNIIGSNIFNAFIVLPVAAVIYPSHLPDLSFSRDLLMLLITAIVLLPYGLAKSHKVHLGRGLGSILLLGYFGYLYALILF